MSLTNKICTAQGCTAKRDSFLSSITTSIDAISREVRNPNPQSQSNQSGRAMTPQLSTRGQWPHRPAARRAGPESDSELEIELYPLNN